MLWPKKNSYKEFDNEKEFLRLKNSPPPPPHDFSNDPSLRLGSAERFGLEHSTRFRFSVL